MMKRKLLYVEALSRDVQECSPNNGERNEKRMDSEMETGIISFVA